jgi:hypothetical protein
VGEGEGEGEFLSIYSKLLTTRFERSLCRSSSGKFGFMIDLDGGLDAFAHSPIAVLITV